MPKGERTKSERIYRDPPFIETDVLEGEEVRRGLKLSASSFYRVAPSLPVSYALGNQSPRYIWGEILKYLARTGGAVESVA